VHFSISHETQISDISAFLVNFLWTTPYVAVSSKLNSVTLVRKRTIPTERPPLVGEVSADFFFAGKRVLRGKGNEFLRPLNLGFLDRDRYFFIQ
jgi:hypothetical protein